jgi:hypothetical protein
VRFTENYFGFIQSRDVLVETGAFQGQSVKFALKGGWGHVHTIDCCKENFEFVRDRFKDDLRVSVHFGSSPDVLRGLCEKLCGVDKQVTFWLDAHFQGVSEGEQDLLVGQCPLLLELNVIFNFEWLRAPVVLIDDAHCFRDVVWPFRCAPDSLGFRRDEWPLLDDIIKCFPKSYDVCELDDVLICRCVG